MPSGLARLREWVGEDEREEGRAEGVGGEDWKGLVGGRGSARKGGWLRRERGRGGVEGSGREWKEVGGVESDEGAVAKNGMAGHSLGGI